MQSRTKPLTTPLAIFPGIEPPLKPSEINQNRPRGSSINGHNFPTQLAKTLYLVLHHLPLYGCNVPLPCSSLSLSLTHTFFTMPLTLSPSSSTSIISQRANLSFFNNRGTGPAFIRLPKSNNNGNVGSGGLVIFASNGVNNRRALEVVFEPFEEVKKELLLVPTEASDSLARQKYTEECVAAINEQIKWVCIINLKVVNFKRIYVIFMLIRNVGC